MDRERGQYTNIKGRAWPAPSSTTSSLHSYEVTTRSPAASTDDLSQDGDSDPSAPCTTATRLASQIAHACENFTIGTRAIFPFPHQDLLALLALYLRRLSGAAHYQ